MFALGDAAKHVVPALIAALDNDDYFVRRTAAAALSHCGSHGAPALSRLNELKETDDDQLRAWIAEAQRRIGDSAPRETA
ncbi:MAG: HEAT repeat domain-containing protein [Pirellulaceae bacterium]